MNTAPFTIVPAKERSVMTKFACAALLSVTALTGTVAWGHDAIVVTATKIPESASTLPMAITPIEGEALQRRWSRGGWKA